MDGGNQELAPQSASEVSDNELHKRAKELARQTKEKGIGQIYGYSLPVEVGGSGMMGFQLGPGFILGEDVEGDQQEKSSLGSVIPVTTVVRDLVGDERYVDSPKQVWLAEKFAPPTKRWKTETGGLFRKRTENHEEIISFNGKHGESDWIKFTYYMPTINKTSRGGDFVQLTVVVPPELAVTIDEAVGEDVYFPDKYFKKLFPEVIGQDISVSMVRRQTNKLLIVDRREVPTAKGELKNYPKPIEY